MNTFNKILITTGLISLSFSATASVYDQLKIQVDTACPIVWEDLGVSISETIPTGDVWQGNSADRATWVTAYALANNLTEVDADVIAGVVAAVASECASFRTALVDQLIANTPADVTLALSSASNGSTAGDYLNGAWMVGDVRATGRATAAPGWVFLNGQTIGSASSAADLAGDEYFGLFELAKTWSPNAGNEDWAGGGVVTLPDMRGRTMVGADNLGGTSADVIANAQADVVGGQYGVNEGALTLAQLPTHSHTMQSNGGHSHSMGSDSHSHKLRTSIYTGSGSAKTTYPYFEGKARTNYQNTIPSGNAVRNDTHNHSLVAAPNHDHDINDSGSSAAVSFLQPSITFNVEMKY